MKAPIFSLLVCAILSIPGAAESQLLTSTWGAEVMATVSGFRDWKCPDQGWRPAGWRPAGTFRARLAPLAFLHVEVAYTYAASKSFEIDESSSYSDPCLSSIIPCGAISDSSHRVTGGLGLQFPGERWRPFIGFGYGTSQGDPVRVGYLGLELSLWERIGFIGEYRIGDQDHLGHSHRTPEIGAGIVWKLR